LAQVACREGRGFVGVRPCGWCGMPQPDMPELSDPRAVFEFAVGPPSGHLRGVEPESLPSLHGMYFDRTRTFVLKKAHLSEDDWRVFDAVTGERVFNAHHPGKNPYGGADPLGLVTTDCPTGEWESVFDVSGLGGGFKVRGKTLSRHGRQRVKTPDDDVIMNVAKRSKLKTMSMRKSFEIREGDHKYGDKLFIVESDAMGRTMQFRAQDGSNDLVALAWKPLKSLALNALLGAGSELQFDVAPGADCSLLIAALFGVLQVGNSLIKDAVSSFVVAPLQDAAVDAALDGSLLEHAGDAVEAVGLDDEAGGLLEKLMEKAGDLGEHIDLDDASEAVEKIASSVGGAVVFLAGLASSED